MAAEAASVEAGDIPQEARDNARALGWEDGLIETALRRGHTLQEVWQALKANVDGTTAKQFLEAEGASIVRPEFRWMEVPTEWGVRARASDPTMGLTLGDLEVGTYGDVPDVWHNRTEIARGSYPAAKPLEDMGYTIFEKAIVWADCTVPLYEVAIRDRWVSATDLPWGSLQPLDDHRERAVCQLMTELSERAYFEGSVLGGWLPKISYGFLEVKLFLSTVIYDLARQAEAFRKRALANGGGLGLQAPTDYARVAQEARSFPELAATLFVLDSCLLTLFKQGALLSQNELERELYALCARDRQRLMDYQVERLKHFVFKMPERRAEQNLYFNKAEHRVAKEWNDPAVSEPLAVLLGGGREGLGDGMVKLQGLRRLQVQEYVENLRRATFVRSGLNARFQELLAEGAETGPIGSRQAPGFA